MLWVRHSHEGRVELHFCTSRLELTTGRSLNIAPPGYQDAYDSLRDMMNQRPTAGPIRWSWSAPRKSVTPSRPRPVPRAATSCMLGSSIRFRWV